MPLIGGRRHRHRHRHHHRHRHGHCMVIDITRPVITMGTTQKRPSRRLKIDHRDDTKTAVSRTKKRPSRRLKNGRQSSAVDAAKRTQKPGCYKLGNRQPGNKGSVEHRCTPRPKQQTRKQNTNKKTNHKLTKPSPGNVRKKNSNNGRDKAADHS